MPIFTRQHYQFLAEFCATLHTGMENLRNYRETPGAFDQDEITEYLCKALEKENSSFKPECFMKAYHKAEG